MQSFTFRNDPLLDKGKKTIKHKGIEIINLYGILLDKKDFLVNYKGQILKTCPYLIDSDCKIREMINCHHDNNFLKLRKELRNYTGSKKCIEIITLKRWMKKGIYPFPLIRILCMLNDRNIFEYIDNAIITDFCQQSEIKLPLKLDIITSPFMSYFVGLHLGDGTLNEERWKIVDGSEHLENLKYSLEFLKKIKKSIKKIYDLDMRGPYKIKDTNAYELVTSNKWFGRFLKNVYSLPFGRKGNMKMVNIKVFKRDKKLKASIIRGLFDTDGYAEDYKVAIGNNNKYLINYIKTFFDDNKIKYTTSVLKSSRTNPLYIIRIPSTDLKVFCKLVGFLHPRKQSVLISTLRKPSLEKRLIGIKRENMIGNSPNLNKINVYFNNKCKSIKFPNKITKEIMYLAKYMRIVKGARKVRIVSKYGNENVNMRKIKRIVKNSFNLNVNKDGYIFSKYFELFFDTFFEYKHIRNPITKTEADKLKNDLQNKWAT